MKKPLILPHFENEDEEREFWSNINLADYYEPSDAEPVSFPNLRPSSRSISIRLPLSILEGVKKQANAMDVPYQSLIKHTLYNEFVAHEPRGRYQAGKSAKDQKSRKSKQSQTSPYLKTKKSPGTGD